MTIHRPAILAVAGLSLALGGCLGTQNRGLESVHQPVVDRTDLALDLQTAGYGLAGGERARLAGWFDAMQLGYGDRVLIDDGTGAGDTARAEVGGVVAGYGLLLGEGVVPSPTPVAPGTVRVVISRMRATVPGCPDWSRPGHLNADQHTSSNYGCAVNANLAAMVADPADLVRGQPGAASNDAAFSSKAIQSYRKRVPTGDSDLKSAKGGN